MKKFSNTQKVLLGLLFTISALFSQTFQVEERKWRLIGASEDIPLNRIIGEACLVYMFDYDQQRYKEYAITANTTKVVKVAEAFFLISKKGSCQFDPNSKSTVKPTPEDSNYDLDKMEKKSGSAFIYRFKLSENEAIFDKAYDYKNEVTTTKDQSVAQKRANYLVQLIPYKYRKTVPYYHALGVSNDGDSPGGLAIPLYTSRNDFTIAINHFVDRGKKEFFQTLIHEYGHAFSLSEGGVGLQCAAGYEKSYDEWICTKAGSEDYKDFSCPAGYETLETGCIPLKGYLNSFKNKFWSEALLKEKEESMMGGGNEDFYEKYKDDFVTGYASTNFAEDFAESFMYFVFYAQPIGDLTKDKKVNFFYQYPELIELRKHIQKELKNIGYWDL